MPGGSAYTAYPLLAGDVDTANPAATAAAKTQHGNFPDQQNKPLACLANICDAMSQTHTRRRIVFTYGGISA